MTIDIRVMFTLELMLRRRGYNTYVLSQLLGNYGDSERDSDNLAAHFNWQLTQYNTDATARAQSDAYSMSRSGFGFFVTQHAEFRDPADKLNLAYSFRLTDGKNLMTVIFGDQEVGWANFVVKTLYRGFQEPEPGLERLRPCFIFVRKGPMASKAKQTLSLGVKECTGGDPTRFQEFDIEELIIDPLDSEMTPIHIPLTEEETQAFFAKSTLPRSQIPPIKIDDAVIKHYGCAPGTIVRINRTANIPGHLVDESRFLRLVVLN